MKRRTHGYHAHGQCQRLGHVLPYPRTVQTQMKLSSQSSDATPSVDEAVTVEAKRLDDVDDVLRVYENKHFLREDGLWTYEFCYG